MDITRCGGRVEVGFRFKLGFDFVDEAFEAAEAFEFVFVADLRGVERGPKEVEGFIVRLQRHRERTASFAAVREGKPRGFRKAARRAVDDFGNQGE